MSAGRVSCCQMWTLLLLTSCYFVTNEITLLNKDLYPQGPSMSVFWGIVAGGQTRVGSLCEEPLLQQL